MDLTRLGAEDVASRLLADYRRSGRRPRRRYPGLVLRLLSGLGAREGRLSARVSSHGRSRARARGGRGARAARARAPVRLARPPSRWSWCICGVAGSGKTTLADELGAAQRLAAASRPISTRKRLAGIAANRARRRPETTRASSPSAPTREMGTARPPVARARRRGDRRCNLPSPRRAGRIPRRARRPRRPGAVRRMSSAGRDTRRARRRRASEPDRVSDADVAVVERQLAELEPLQEIPAGSSIQLTTDAPVQELLGEVEAFVDRLTWRRSLTDQVSSHLLSSGGRRTRASPH